MRSQEEENQIIQAFSAIEEFTKIFAKNYPLVFKNGDYAIRIYPKSDRGFPYEVILEIKEKK